VDPRILPVSRTWLTRKLRPALYDERKNDVSKELQNATCVTLQFDLWMTMKTEEIFSLNANVGHKNIHLGMPYSSGCTAGGALSLAVKLSRTLLFQKKLCLSRKMVEVICSRVNVRLKIALIILKYLYRSSQYLSGVIARAKRATLTAENLAMLVFINKIKGYKSNKRDTPNKVDNIFEGSFHDMQEEIDDVEDFFKENGEDLM